MTRIYRTTLEVVKQRLLIQNPDKGHKFGMVAMHTSLMQPDLPQNRLYGTVHWPIAEDPNAACDFRINFPKERLKNGQGYIGTTFRFERPAAEGAVMETSLLIVHGIGSIGLVEPLSASMTETLTDGVDPLIDPVWTLKSPEEANEVLAMFGITEWLV